MRIIKTYESFSVIPKFQIFGSKSSQDYDVMVFVSSIPESKEESKDQCEKYNKLLSEYFAENGLISKELNCNLGVLQNGVVVSVFKGTPDEVNNSMYLTYGNFKQFYPNQIERLISRDYDLKILRCFRIILSFLSRSEYRVKVKLALRSDLKTKIETLKSIDFTSPIETGNKNINKYDFYKALAFQVGQTLAFEDNLELYTKEDIYERYPELEGFLKRDNLNYDYSGLQNLIDRLIQFAESKEYLLDKDEISYAENH